MKGLPGDLAVRLECGRQTDDIVQVTIATWNPDVDDHGVNRDYGEPLIEGGEVVADMTRPDLYRFASLLEHAPNLLALVEDLIASGADVPQTWLARARRTVLAIEGGDLKYRY